MATTNKIVDTRRLASKGRFGDTKIRKIDGKPAHVNAYEAHLIDRYGEKGRDKTKRIGSGTINPRTGLEEYNHEWWHSGDWWFGENSVLGQIAGGDVRDQTFIESMGNISGAATGMNPIYNIEMMGETYEAGTGKPAVIGGIDITNIGTITKDFFSDPKRWTSPEKLKEERDLADIKAQAGTIMTEGFGGLHQKLIDYIGGDGEKGILRTERDIARGGISRGAQSQLESLVGGVSGAGGKGGFAKAGALENVLRKGTKGVMAEYGGAMGTSNLKYQKDVTDVRAETKKTMNQMIIDYQVATGEAYDLEGDDAYQTLLEEFNMDPHAGPAGTDTSIDTGTGTGTGNPLIDLSNLWGGSGETGNLWGERGDAVSEWLGGFFLPGTTAPGGTNLIPETNLPGTGNQLIDLSNLWAGGTSLPGGISLPGSGITSWEDKFGIDKP